MFRLTDEQLRLLDEEMVSLERERAGQRMTRTTAARVLMLEALQARVDRRRTGGK